MSISTLTEANFMLYAAKHYDNPHCFDISEFNEDLNRFKYIKRLFSRYRDTGELKERLILNHIIILYNLFGVEATTRMLFFKLPEYYPYLKPFLLMLNYLPKQVDYVHTDEIVMDMGVVERLRKI